MIAERYLEEERNQKGRGVGEDNLQIVTGFMRLSNDRMHPTCYTHS